MPQTQKTEAAPPNGTPPAKLDDYLAFVQALAATGRGLLPVTENLLREKFALQEAVDQLRTHHEALREEIESGARFTRQWRAAALGLRAGRGDRFAVRPGALPGRYHRCPP